MYSELVYVFRYVQEEEYGSIIGEYEIIHYNRTYISILQNDSEFHINHGRLAPIIYSTSFKPHLSISNH